MPKYFDPRDFFPHLKDFFPPDVTPKMPSDVEEWAEEQKKAQNPAYWMQMGQLAATNSAAMPWVWYGMMLGTMEAMRDSGGASKKVKKRHKEAVKAVRKFTKHVAGNSAVEPPQVAKDAEKATRKAVKKAAKATQKMADNMQDAMSKTADDVQTAIKSSTKDAMAIANAMSSPRGGIADDLKMIAGIGPKLEKTLNDMGIYHFDQISKWSQTDIDGVDEYLKFSGRILRENWIRQADALARGGAEEYFKVFGKQPR